MPKQTPLFLLAILKLCLPTEECDKKNPETYNGLM